MKKWPIVLFFIPLVLLALSGCSEMKGTEEDLFQYKNSYAGDAGAVGNITRQLPNPDGEQLNGLELRTSEEPYGIILNYIDAENRNENGASNQELAIYNATFILALVKNADWVAFRFSDGELKISREQLDALYGKDIREFENEKDLSTLIQHTLEDENKARQFFN